MSFLSLEPLPCSDLEQVMALGSGMTGGIKNMNEGTFLVLGALGTDRLLSGYISTTFLPYLTTWSVSSDAAH